MNALHAKFCNCYANDNWISNMEGPTNLCQLPWRHVLKLGLRCMCMYLRGCVSTSSSWGCVALHTQQVLDICRCLLEEASSHSTPPNPEAEQIIHKLHQLKAVLEM